MLRSRALKIAWVQSMLQEAGRVTDHQLKTKASEQQEMEDMTIKLQNT